MDYSLNLISLDKKIRFYCGDKIHTFEPIPSNLKNELWWSEKSHKKATNEMLSEIRDISQLKNITFKEAQNFLYGIDSIKS